MRTIVFALFLLMSFSSLADQLAYISQQDAELAANKINKLSKVYLFCGCCSLEKPEKVKVVKATATYTGYENYYEVVLDYIDENGVKGTAHLDLAYTWKKGLFGYKTVGKMLNLEHDYCVNPKDWNNPKYIEKDI